jgi:UDP-N-acetylmuramate--alanine ligase
MVVDDYGHHPPRSAPRWPGRAALTRAGVSWSPFSRTATRGPAIWWRTSPSAFNEAELLFVAPIYAASEPPIPGVNSEMLVEAIRRHGHRDVRLAPSIDALVESLAQVAQPGDLILAFGAGDIGRTGAQLVAKLGGTP